MYTRKDSGELACIVTEILADTAKYYRKDYLRKTDISQVQKE